MPLPVAHGLLGASVVAAIHSQPNNRYFLPLLVGAFLANAADFDFAFVFLLHSRAWHRGFSHSIIFALFVCLIFILFLGKRYIKEAIAYGLAYTSHAMLDYITTKEGGGVELLWPFSSERLVLGWVGLSEFHLRGLG
jgi:inner membrane protein